MDVPEHVSKWEVKPGEKARIRFALYEPEKGQLHLTLEEDRRESVVQHWVDVKIWDFDEMVKLKKKAQQFNEQARTFYIDPDDFNELKLKYLLLAWSFGELDPHMKLQHANGVLTDESMKKVKKIKPWVLAHMLIKINEVLEGIVE